MVRFIKFKQLKMFCLKFPFDTDESIHFNNILYLRILKIGAQLNSFWIKKLVLVIKIQVL